MNEQSIEEATWLLSRTRGVGLVLRALMLVSPLAALGCTRLAGGTLPFIAFPVIALSLLCVLVPDSHIGLFVVLLVAAGWLATVDDTTTPWSIGVAVSLTAFHASVAAATVAPPAARWTRAMRRRWSRRSLIVMIASAGTWLVVATVDRYEIPSSGVLLTASLLALAVAGMWARNGKLASGTARRD
ncbi:hypothetical protein BH10ACT2_BH10ACT2_26810 [soil metagenome]